MSAEQLLLTLAQVENVLYSLISGIGIIANIIVFLVITIWERYRANRTVANLFTANLAVADLIFLVILPLNMPAMLDTNGWTLGPVMCKLMQAIKYINFRASILFLLTMSMDRYLAIVYTLESRMFRTRRATIKICIALWLLSVASSVPVVIYADIENEELSPKCTVMFPGYQNDIVKADVLYDFIYDLGSGEALDLEGITYNGDSTPENNTIKPYTCFSENTANSTANTAWVYSTFSLFFVVPVLVTLFCYISIVKVTISRQIDSNSKTKQYHVAVMVGILVLAFVICWTPFQVWQLIKLSRIEPNYWGECDVVRSVTELMAWSNSALNPILYSLSSQRFRHKAVKCWRYMRFGYQRSMLMEQQSARTQNTTKLTSLHTRNKTITPGGQTSGVQTLDRVNPTYKPEDCHENTTV